MKKTLSALLTIAASYPAIAAPQIPSDAEIQGRNTYFITPYKATCDVIPVNQPTSNTAEEAMQLEQIFDKTLGYSLTLNAKGQAYIQLAIKEWNEKMVFAVNPDVKITIKGADINGQYITNKYCLKQNLALHHVNTHEWGSYLVELQGKPNQLISLRIVKE
ncbi:hypothetical protein CTM97_21570 [Photobacterium phosphoreum]|uniref:Uncharacterized protein n=1 Tax=Photobacterium phosphoreum TaxID=659 RepID=A0A2T3JA36_PHOPO|nr:hypothetical protein [Photobacterium phosphoreum]PSU18341.1 hypothetical protein CTM96_21645 [Photobacterium phosphoreum]PSU35446.1 hypothetical protein CTM97_21570 [Photobacterium phosphoreum]PSU45710.1 hypothetical protein C9J18_21540 [Photobacterium phosphoreum]